MPLKSLSEMKPRERFFAGFILHKLWIDRYWCGEGRKQHNGHTSLDNIPKGRPRNEMGEILKVAEDLRRMGFICHVSATKDTHVCASRSPQIIKEGLPIINEYRHSVGLPPLKPDEI